MNETFSSSNRVFDAMYNLRPYQKEAVDASLRHFRKSRNPAVLVLPTGAGKSLVIAELARIARGRVLVLAHVKELVEQNYSKYLSYGLEAGIYSAGLQRKDKREKVIFGGIQSVARAGAEFFKDFSLLIIDECHRVSSEDDAQYSKVIGALRGNNPQLCILGLTATPFRLDGGWIYQFNHRGFLRTSEPRLFRKCIFDLTLRSMVDAGYLTPPVQIDAPVAAYDFSSLKVSPETGLFSVADIERSLKEQKRITPVIIANIVEMAKDREAVLIFTSSVRHAEEILPLLPTGISAMVIGDTPGEERDKIIERFKQRELKFLVNVSVLTTGFDAPHVDVIAILRPTESVGLYQQIVGRGLRLSPGKVDCLVLDYTGVAHDIYVPEIGDKKPSPNSVPVKVPCPECEHINEFWGLEDSEGNVVEHFGRKCRGAIESADHGDIVPCRFRYRFKNCERCGGENDIAARVCAECGHVLVDDDVKLQRAMALKDVHVLRPDSMVFEKRVDKQGRERLEVRYYDLDARYLSEIFYINDENEAKVFFYNFTRMHNRRPEQPIPIRTVDEALGMRDKFRVPAFIIARKQNEWWKIREKIFPS